MERRQNFVDGDIDECAWTSTDLLVDGVAHDPTDPGSEGRVTPEHADLPHHAQTRILDSFRGILLVTRNPCRQAMARWPNAVMTASGAVGSRSRRAVNRSWSGSSSIAMSISVVFVGARAGSRLKTRAARWDCLWHVSDFCKTPRRPWHPVAPRRSRPHRPPAVSSRRSGFVE